LCKWSVTDSEFFSGVLGSGELIPGEELAGIGEGELRISLAFDE